MTIEQKTLQVKDMSLSEYREHLAGFKNYREGLSFEEQLRLLWCDIGSFGLFGSWYKQNILIDIFVEHILQKCQEKDGYYNKCVSHIENLIGGLKCIPEPYYSSLYVGIYKDVLSKIIYSMEVESNINKEKAATEFIFTLGFRESVKDNLSKLIKENDLDRKSVVILSGYPDSGKLVVYVYNFGQEDSIINAIRSHDWVSAGIPAFDERTGHRNYKMSCIINKF